MTLEAMKNPNFKSKYGHLDQLWTIAL